MNLSAIQLTFADDVRGQLPEVVRVQHGMLALLDRDGDRTIARYLFVPPAWELHSVRADLSGGLRLQMDPPGRWEVFRMLARRHNISLDRYRACAVFDIGYRRCLQDAIHRRALAAGQSPGRRISAARVAFTAASPCGVEVLDVSFAGR